jgi:hypothetical protein
MDFDYMFAYFELKVTAVAWPLARNTGVSFAQITPWSKISDVPNLGIQHETALLQYAT